MDRTDRPPSFITLVGIAATIVGIVLCLFFLFAPATFGTHVPDAVVNSPVDMQISMRWLQPLLGQAIVEDTLIKQQYGIKIGEAVKASNHMANADHAARVQWVMGRLIVDLTGHRVQAGVLTADRFTNEGNQRIIAVAQQAGAQLDDAFRTTWQAGIGKRL